MIEDYNKIRKYNLLYHIYLNKNNIMLKYNLFLLKEHLTKFNGKKIININYDTNVEYAKAFAHFHFGSYHDIEIILTSNDESPLRETYVFFNKLLPKVYSLNEYEYTFFGHAKGVTRYQTHKDLILFLWCHTLYSRNLNNFNNIANILDTHTCCGTLKIDEPIHFPDNLGVFPWHYTGAFFWFNNKKIFSKPNWHDHIQSRYGIETYLPRLVNSKEAFGILPHMTGDTHDILNWEKTYTGAQI